MSAAEGERHVPQAYRSREQSLAQKSSGSGGLPEVARMVKRAKEVSNGFHHSPVTKARCARNITDKMPRSLAV